LRRGDIFGKVGCVHREPAEAAVGESDGRGGKEDRKYEAQDIIHGQDEYMNI
jgi:hypothetical protein